MTLEELDRMLRLLEERLAQRCREFLAHRLACELAKGPPAQDAAKAAELEELAAGLARLASTPAGRRALQRQLVLEIHAHMLRTEGGRGPMLH
jgi:hypothetical protein